MKFIQGFPRMENATDMMDSCMLNSMMSIFGHEKAVDPREYLIGADGVVRCLVAEHDNDWSTNPNNVTLDQMIPLMAALKLIPKHIDPLNHAAFISAACRDRGWKAQNTEADKPGSTKPWWNGPDRILFAQREFMKNILYGTNEDYWLTKYISFHAFWTPLSEPNQLIAMIMASASPKMYALQWRFKNPLWRTCIREYYSSQWRFKNPLWRTCIRGYYSSEKGYDRGEYLFAERIIDKLKELK